MKMKNVFKAKKLTIFLPVLLILFFLAIPLFAADQYTYDSLGRLKTVTHSDGTTIQYNYDKTGNRTTGGETVLSSNHPPNSPYPTNPIDCATEVLSGPVFTWDGGDPDGANDTVWYSIYLDQGTCWTSSPCESAVNPSTFIDKISAPGNVTSISYTWVHSLSLATCYYWKVVPEDSKGAKPLDPIEVWSFKTSGGCS